MKKKKWIFSCCFIRNNDCRNARRRDTRSRGSPARLQFCISCKNKTGDCVNSFIIFFREKFRTLDFSRLMGETVYLVQQQPHPVHHHQKERERRKERQGRVGEIVTPRRRFISRSVTHRANSKERAALLIFQTERNIYVDMDRAHILNHTGEVYVTFFSFRFVRSISRSDKLLNLHFSVCLIFGAIHYRFRKTMNDEWMENKKESEIFVSLIHFLRHDSKRRNQMWWKFTDASYETIPAFIFFSQ